MGDALTVLGERIEDQAKLDRQWRPILMAYFLRRVRNHAEAEDLTQEVYARALGADVEMDCPEAYVFRIAANLLANRARAARVRFKNRDNLPANDEIDFLDPFRIAAERVELSLILEAIAELPERTRSMFILYRMENMSQDMIAQSYGISASAVKKQIAKAMAHLMARMRAAR